MENKQAFYEAIFNSTTLDQLICYRLSVTDIDLSNLSFPMQTLKLHQCDFSSAQRLTALAKQLIGSGVIELTVGGYYDNDISGIVYFFHILPQTRVKSLQLTHFCLPTRESWQRFAELVESCRLESLVMTRFNTEADEVKLFARAIQNNKSIRDMELSLVGGNGFNTQEMKMLIESATDVNRPVTLRAFIISCKWRGSIVERSKLVEFAISHGVKRASIQAV
ncbi:hypothetical protein AC1031_005867 [Aphanomyces cochlioides]|nr:hypothetical protein AC1031_005867 [Aphanomyces cochlioides]